MALAALDERRVALGVGVPAAALLAGRNLAVASGFKLCDQRRLFELRDRAEHLPDQHRRGCVFEEEIGRTCRDKRHTKVLQEVMTGELYRQVASETVRALDDDGANAVAPAFAASTSMLTISAMSLAASFSARTAALPREPRGRQALPGLVFSARSTVAILHVRALHPTCQCVTTYVNRSCCNWKSNHKAKHAIKHY
jgi:hypothetical protein